LLAAAAVSAGLRTDLYCIDDAKVVSIASHGVKIIGRGEALVKLSAAQLSLASSRKGRYDIVVVTLPLNFMNEELYSTVKLMLTPRSYGAALVQPSPFVLEKFREKKIPIASYLALYTCAWQTSETSVEWVGEGFVRCSGSEDACTVIKAMLESIGLRVEVYNSTYIDSLAWEALAAAAALQPLSALLGVGYSRLAASQHALQLAHSIAREVSLVADGAGIRLLRTPVEAVEDMLKLRGCRPKMLRDIELRRPSEIDYINGYVIRKAALNGLYTPYNMSVYLAVKALEDVMRG
jgi:ketopantoate reductase